MKRVQNVQNLICCVLIIWLPQMVEFYLIFFLDLVYLTIITMFCELRSYLKTKYYIFLNCFLFGRNKHTNKPTKTVSRQFFLSIKIFPVVSQFLLAWFVFLLLYHTVSLFVCFFSLSVRKYLFL